MIPITIYQLRILTPPHTVTAAQTPFKPFIGAVEETENAAAATKAYTAYDISADGTLLVATYIENFPLRSHDNPNISADAYAQALSGLEVYKIEAAPVGGQARQPIYAIRSAAAQIYLKPKFIDNSSHAAVT